MMFLWFSQSHLPAITSLKAHCQDYPYLKGFNLTIILFPLLILFKYGF